MHTTNLRKVGGSVMLVVPPLVLEQLQLRAGESVGLTIEHGQLIIKPKPKSRYSLAELLAASDYTQAQSDESREWIDAPSAGNELI